MNRLLLTFLVTTFFIANAIGQINPIQNLTWDQYYEFPNNYFNLEWEAPSQPHDNLIGYNVYRENDLYRFQTETSLYLLPEGANCEIDFLFYNEGMPFYAHVTAVYEGEIESDYDETVYVKGAALSINQYNKQKQVIYPNPASEIVSVANSEIKTIKLYNLSGKLIKSESGTTQFNVSDLTKGIYILKLFSEEHIYFEKLIIK